MNLLRKDLSDMRIDKFLCNSGFGSRTDVNKLLKSGRVKVNNQIVKNKDMKIDEYVDYIYVDGVKIEYDEFHYIMMNKPANYVTSTKDTDPTVMELLGEYDKYNVVPVGRLDKDTEGLLLFTNDGILAHNLTSPKKHVEKTYYVELDVEIKQEYIEIFKQGVILDDGYHTLPSKLEILDSHHIYLTIMEGKFHQVKRMMEAINNKVKYLKRISFGPLILDKKLELGECRKLTKEEIEQLLKHKK